MLMRAFVASEFHWLSLPLADRRRLINELIISAQKVIAYSCQCVKSVSSDNCKGTDGREILCKADRAVNSNASSGRL